MWSLFFVICSHPEEWEATLQVVNGPVKSLEGSIMQRALSTFWVQGSEEDAVRNSEKDKAWPSDTASNRRERA